MKRQPSAEALYRREIRKRRAHLLTTGTLTATRDKGAGARKPAITSPTIQRLIEEARPAYNRAIEPVKAGRPRSAA